MIDNLICVAFGFALAYAPQIFKYLADKVE